MDTSTLLMYTLLCRCRCCSIYYYAISTLYRRYYHSIRCWSTGDCGCGNQDSCPLAKGAKEGDSGRGYGSEWMFIGCCVVLRVMLHEGLITCIGYLDP